MTAPLQYFFILFQVALSDDYHSPKDLVNRCARLLPPLAADDDANEDDVTAPSATPASALTAQNASRAQSEQQRLRLLRNNGHYGSRQQQHMLGNQEVGWVFLNRLLILVYVVYLNTIYNIISFIWISFEERCDRE